MSDAQAQSQASWRQMEDAWGQACEAWRDSTTDYFEAHLWAPLADASEAYLRAVDELMAVLRTARDAAS
jgi:hypothetical protein